MSLPTIFELTLDETKQIVGGTNNNSTWVEEHPWETAGIAIGSVLGTALIGLNIYVIYKWIVYNKETGYLPHDHPLREFGRIQRQQHNNLIMRYKT